ncbi:aldo/keto reductase [Chitinophagaceae bacterium LB-8]|uniref:Aldo/keto reductase n=1 Tax=Paraflavisolibacter caeni TaxID=2982496 RepID=A0A9X2Y0S5_9BACT|nr:aldo/keto reductase [Paraflavisolibacter caeni]MCU7552556.1 aldo/keto reductase [Paraflavisolibacter caeni]
MVKQSSTPAFLDRCILGTVGLGGVWHKVDPDESISTIIAALENGIGAIDTAPAYGNAEEYVGKALRQWSGPQPVISTKVGRLKGFAADEGRYDYSVEGMQRSVEQSLETLGVSSLDVLFLHDPLHMAEENAGQVIETMLSFKEKGYAKKIGLGGNPPSWMAPYLKPEIFDVLMEFNKLNAVSTVALNEYLPFCLANHIQYYAASPLNMGLLGSCYDAFVSNPPAWLGKHYIDAAVSVKALADAQSMTLPALAHRFLLSLPYAFQIVIGASDKTQLAATIEAFQNGPLPGFMVGEIMKYTNGKTN